MAAESSETLGEAKSDHMISVIRVLLAAGLSAAAVFALCWIGASLPYDTPTHAYIGLFTPAHYGSGRALAEGLSWSVLFGGVVGGTFALIYNATAYLGRG